MLQEKYTAPYTLLSDALRFSNWIFQHEQTVYDELQVVPGPRASFLQDFYQLRVSQDPKVNTRPVDDDARCGGEIWWWLAVQSHRLFLADPFQFPPVDLWRQCAYVLFDEERNLRMFVRRIFRLWLRKLG
jgi:hypothetical protein